MNGNGNDNTNGNGNTNTNTDNRAFDLSKFTTEEKLSWLGGYDLWNLRAIPGVTASTHTESTRTAWSRTRTKQQKPNPTRSLCLSDGPHGLRKPLNDFALKDAHPATCFPSACSTACSWNPKIIEMMGRALSLECEHYNVQVLLGPGINLKRHPCGGRNHEYYSEDPFLTGVLAKSYIGGIQESGRVGACIKHFCLNNQESNRFVVDVIVDERTMRELYLPAFEQSLSRQKDDTYTDPKCVPKLVMAAYNKVNGTYCCEHKYLLGEILRGEWKYDGVVVSDWGAIHDRSASIRAGMDLEMPGTPTIGAFDEEVLADCASYASEGENEHDEEQPINNDNKNELETAIDDCANRVVRLVDDLQRKNRDQAVHDPTELFAKHDLLAREIARECIVLLQNKDGFLPLSQNECFVRGTPKFGLVGGFAKDSSRYQGMGSAHVTPTKLTSLYDALASFFRSESDSSSDNTFSIPFAKGYEPDTDGVEINQSLIDEALLLAKEPDLDFLVVCVGLPEIAESEGFDRVRTGLPKQHVSLVEALTKVHPNVVVVISNGGIVDIPQSFLEGTKSIIDAFLLGQACGPALVDVLFGVVSPSGRLPETIPIAPDDSVPSANYFPGSQQTVEYREGLDVGYRYYDTVEIPVRFPFGHGLHYTRFEYRNLGATIEYDSEASKRVRVSLNVQNIGNKFREPCMEVVQLYIQPIGSSVYRPRHELKGFQKIEIAPGATETVEFVLDERSFSFYDIGWKDWIVESGCGFEIQVGASSRDIRLIEKLHFSNGKEASKLAKDSYPPIIANNNNNNNNTTAAVTRLVVDDETFFKRFGCQAPTGSRSSGTTGNRNEDQGETPSDQHDNDNTKAKKAVTRNTLIVDAARISRIAGILMSISWIVATKEVKAGPTKNRELRMIRANLENVPLRSLVVFSQGNLTFRALDVLIHLMNGSYRKAFNTAFRRDRNRRRN